MPMRTAHRSFSAFYRFPGVTTCHTAVAIYLALGGLAYAQTLRVASESAPAGGYAQIKVYTDSPTLISRGVLGLDLDPRFFGPITSISTFSAAGDAIAFAVVEGTHVSASISAASGGIGQLPGVPVFVVNAPVLASPQSSGFVSLSLPPYSPTFITRGVYPDDEWADAGGKSFQPTLVSGRWSLSGPSDSIGTLSVKSVTPGAGLHPAGTVVVIEGTSFDVSTKLSVAGMGFSSVKAVSPNRIEATLMTTSELTGTRFHLEQENNPQATADFFAAAPSAVDVDRSGTTHVVIPVSTGRYTGFGGTQSFWEGLIFNPVDIPANVLVREFALDAPLSGRRITVAPGTWAVVPATRSFNSLYLDSDVPVRMAYYREQGLKWIGVAPSDGSFPAIQISPSPGSINVNYQTGAPNPAPLQSRIFYRNGVQDVTIRTDAGSWLSVTSENSSAYTTLTLNIDPAGLQPGQYKGTINITPVVASNLEGFTAVSPPIQVTLNVSAQPFLSVTGTQGDNAPGAVSFNPKSLVITSGSTPASFTASVSTTDGGKWISLDATSGVTPATVNLRYDAAGLAPGFYTGKVAVKGPANTVEVDASMNVHGVPAPPATGFQSSYPQLTFVRESGLLGTDAATSLQFGPVVGSSFSVSVRADTPGANWLEVTNAGISQNSAYVVVNVNATKLAPGTYRSVIEGTSGGNSASTEVTLTVLPKLQAPPTANVTSLTFTTPAGVQSAAQRFIVSPGVPIIYSLDIPAPIYPSVRDANGLLPAQAYDLVVSSSSPGTYQSAITLISSAGTTIIPVTINITASAAVHPFLTSIVNSASNLPGPLAPGELITIHGTGVGPAQVGLKLDAQGRLQSTASDARVEINGIAAPIVYGSVGQWNVIVPYEVEGSTLATVQVFAVGLASEKWTMPVTTTAPAIFTVGSTGIGQAAVLNQDNTVNGPTNRAAHGTVVQIYVTGGGALAPAAVTGSVTPSGGAGRTRLPVKVQLLGDAAVTYAGPAPGLASGVLQVNAVIPNTSFGTTQAPVTVEADGVRSQAGVTVWVR